MKHVNLKLLILLLIYTFVNNLNKESKECTKDEDCNYMNKCINFQCKHKQFIPPTKEEIIGAFAILVGSAFSNAGGIGGGGLLIPILILVLNFGTQEAIPISKLMIFTGAITAFIMGLKNKHPYRNGIPLDLNVAGLLVPMLLFGTMVGVSLNKVMPPSIILISLTVVLLINTFKTFSKGIKLFKKENDELGKAIEKAKERNSEESESLKSNNLSDANYSTLPYNKKSCNATNLSETLSVYTSDDSELESGSNNNKLLKIEFEKDKINFPVDKLVLMAFAYISLIIISLLKGSDHFKSLIDIQPCSSPYWIIYFIYFPIAIWVTFKYSQKILVEYNYRLSINYPYHSSDVKWTPAILIIYPLFSFLGGIMAGLLGIGGGLIYGPLLLELGLNPIVSTATSNFLVLFTSSSTSMQFILIGAMNFNYGFFCTICSTIGSYLGTVAIQRLLEKTGRASVLIFSMALVEAISSVCIPLHAYNKIQRNYNHNVDIWKFNSPC